LDSLGQQEAAQIQHTQVSEIGVDHNGNRYPERSCQQGLLKPALETGRLEVRNCKAVYDRNTKGIDSSRCQDLEDEKN
jgi:hypothetical protein